MKKKLTLYLPKSEEKKEEKKNFAIKEQIVRIAKGIYQISFFVSFGDKPVSGKSVMVTFPGGSKLIGPSGDDGIASSYKDKKKTSALIISLKKNEKRGVVRAIIVGTNVSTWFPVFNN